MLDVVLSSYPESLRPGPSGILVSRTRTTAGRHRGEPVVTAVPTTTARRRPRFSGRVPGSGGRARHVRASRPFRRRSSAVSATRKTEAIHRLNCFIVVNIGVPGGIRTHGPRIRNPVLYPAELRRLPNFSDGKPNSLCPVRCRHLWDHTGSSLLCSSRPTLVAIPGCPRLAYDPPGTPRTG